MKFLTFAAAVLSLGHAALANDADVAKACADVAEYARELGLVHEFGKSGYAEGAAETLRVAKSRFSGSVDTLYILAGSKTRTVVFDDSVGIRRMEAAAGHCVSHAECLSESAQIAGAFSAAVVGFCRQDIEDSR